MKNELFKINYNLLIKTIKERPQKKDYWKEHDELKQLFEEYKGKEEELHAILKEREEQEKKEREQEERRQLKEELLTDNLFYLINHLVFEDIKEYLSKNYFELDKINIGEKTAEKIGEELEKILIEKYDVNDFKIHFRRTNEDYLSWIEFKTYLYFNNDFLRYEKVNDNNYLYFDYYKDEERRQENHFNYYRTTLNYFELNHLNKTINYILKTRQELKEEKERLNKKIKDFNERYTGSASRDNFGVKEC